MRWNWRYLVLPIFSLLIVCERGKTPVIEGVGRFDENKTTYPEDRMAPEIEHSPYEMAIQKGMDVPIYAKVRDDSGIGGVFLYHRKSGETNFYCTRMVGDDDTYKGTIPWSLSSDQDTEYYIMAYDSSAHSNISYSPEGAPLELHLIRYFDFEGFAPSCRLPDDEENSFYIGCSDLNGDGHPDIVLANWGHNSLYLNNGDGIFAVDENFFSDSIYAWTYSLEITDVNGDGRDDLYFSNYYFNLQDRLYLFDRTFVDVTDSNLPVDSSPTCGIATGDIDGDGDIDIVTGNSEQLNAVYINDGYGSFTNESETRIPQNVANSKDVTLRDFDGDGDLDIVFVNWYSGKFLYLNDGNGYFSDHSDRIPQDTACWVWGVSAEDFDLDGDYDLFFACEEIPSAFLYLNDGNAWFSDVTTENLPGVYGYFVNIHAVDIDIDGDMDILLPCLFCQNHLLLNDGEARFTDYTDHLPVDDSPTTSIASCDIEEDGDIDIVTANSEEITGPAPNILYLNDGAMNFTDTFCTGLPSAIKSCITGDSGDLDGDSEDEILLSCNGYLYLLTFDGSDFSEEVSSPFQGLLRVEEVKFVDYDMDGHEDIFMLIDRGLPRLLKNNGNSSYEYAKGAIPDIDVEFRCAFVEDFDGNSYPDILLITKSGFLFLLRNELNGTFSIPSIPWFTPSDEPILSLDYEDIDGDGDMDIFTLSSSFVLSISINRGDAHFLEPSVIFDAGSYGISRDILEVCDLNGDALPEILLNGADRLVIVTTDDGATFYHMKDLMSGDISTLAVRDMDGNLEPDILIAGERGISLYLNRGNYDFEISSISVEDTGVVEFLILDINSDYRWDFITVADIPRVYFNE